MKMSDIVLRLIRGWYDPADQLARERRTEAARAKAISVRIRAESVQPKIVSARRSYERANDRLNGG